MCIRDSIELSILQLAKIIEKKSINNKIYLPISDRIIQNSFLEISPFGNDNINYKSDELSEAVIMYDSLIEKYNNSRARYNIANLKSNNDDNYEKSLNDFYALEQNSSNRNIRFKSAIRIIEIKIKNNLIKSGYRLNDKGSIGRVDGILVREDKMLEGGADKRGDDTAIGF